MTKEQYEKLKEWVEAVASEKVAKLKGKNGVTKFMKYRQGVEKELDKLMGFEE